MEIIIRLRGDFKQILIILIKKDQNECRTVKS